VFTKASRSKSTHGYILVCGIGVAATACIDLSFDVAVDYSAISKRNSLDRVVQKDGADRALAARGLLRFGMLRFGTSRDPRSSASHA
jgi:hypothetical protein